MITYKSTTIAEAWQDVCGHHLEFAQHVMDTDISKAGPCCLSIQEPCKRVPTKSTNPFIPFFLSVLAMTPEDKDPSVVAKYAPEIAEFRDDANCFSLAMGYRIQERGGYDQGQMLKEVLRLGMQVLPVTLFDPSLDHSLQHRPSTLSVVFSIFNEKLEVMVTCDVMLLHEVPFHSELSVISIWQEMLAAHLGKRIGPMNVVAGATAAMQSDHGTFSKVVSEEQSPLLQNLYVMGNESDPEILMSDFKTWPLVGVGRGYMSDFFKHTVIPMTMTLRALKKDGADIHDRKAEACGAAERIADAAWRAHVVTWITHYFTE
jgi:hypothetical protein